MGRAARTARGRRDRAATAAWWLGPALAAWFLVVAWQTLLHFPLRGEPLARALDLARFPAWTWSAAFSQGAVIVRTLGLTAAWLAAAYALGGWVRRRWLEVPRSRLETLLTDVGLGFALWSLGLFALGFLGGWRTWVFAPLLLGAALWGAARAWRRRGEWRPGRGWLLGPRPAPADRAWLLVAAAAALGAFASALAPELFFDALVYHLAVPAQWLAAGGFIPLPHNYFSHLPMGVELLYLGSLLLGDESVCRALHVLLGLIGAAAVFALGRRWFGRRAGVWAAGIFLTLPVVWLNLQVAGVDVAASAWAALGVLALFDWALSAGGGEAAQDRRRLVTAGIICGAALAAKYNTAFVLAPATVAAGVLAWRRGLRAAGLFRAMLLAGALVLVWVGPWWLKNLAETGNPVYPFLYRWLPSPQLDPEKMSAQMHEFREYYHRTPGQFLRQPWDLSLLPATSNSFVGTVFLFLAPGLLLLVWEWRRGPPAAAALLAVAVLAALLWSSQTRIARYYLPAFPVLAALGAAALERLQALAPRWGRAARWGVAGLALWGLSHVLMIWVANHDSLGVILGRESRWSYLDRMLMNSYAPAARAVRTLPPSVRLLCFGDSRTYYLGRRATAPTVFDRQPLIAWLEAGPDAGAVWARLRAEGYTHLFLHGQEAVRTRGYEPHRWSEAAVGRLQALRGRYLRPVHVRDDQWLYALRKTPDRGAEIKPGRPLYAYDREAAAAAARDFDLAIRALQQGRLEQARAHAQACARTAPAWYRVHMLLGEIAFRQGAPQEGFDRFARAAALDWLPPFPSQQLGLLYLQQGRPDLAEPLLRQALAFDPALAEARRALAGLAGQKGGTP